ncbi:hypothetical protein BX659_12429 [Orenia metallireducens]|jgi:hypothetical protein|uniref:Uncharacterized protein n=1 Tax=Orenia metallireducens TaxID=1413210 RepID=A0A285G853_9FIRM|nr:HD domain-containing protein [Orenia metallireducens]PRX24205.1 hypothetical protein BX659_12429 [Orenia metallireducens]SNY19732.1 hypothetical protein SAMN06265827_105180 [Orenia metallireducens]
MSELTIERLITVEEVKKHPLIKAYISKANEHLASMGYTEHGFRHAGLISKLVGDILTELDYSTRIIELGKIAGYIHDIGNVVNRHDHDQHSAIIAENLLREMGMDYEEIAMVIGAIGNHDENFGEPVNVISAALIIADKSDVHYTRVRNKEFATFDIHDRVNYAAKESIIKVNKYDKTITLELEIDLEIISVIEYFEIFLTRMLMSRKAAITLDCNFHLIINNTKLL